MRKHITVALAALCLAPAALAAQGLPRLGGQVSVAQDVNAGLGLRVELPLSRALARDLRVAVAFDEAIGDFQTELEAFARDVGGAEKT